MRVLAGDIGGTKTWLQIAEFSEQAAQGKVIYEQRYMSRAYPDFNQMLQEFLSNAPGLTFNLPGRACFAVAGPVQQTSEGQSVNVTNLPWQLDTHVLAGQLDIPKIKLINDFQAIGHGIEALEDEDLITLQTGQAEPTAPRLVIGPGTGLGVGLLVWRDGQYEALASEGGHMDFAPNDTLQSSLLEYLRQRLGHVSCERVISGPGLVNIYEFLCTQSAGQPLADLCKAARSDDPAAAISVAALRDGNRLAMQAIDLFVSLCGSYAGNLSLLSLAYGGVYLAGGIAPKLIERFTSGVFLNAFTSKGRMSPRVLAMPVYLIVNPKVGLMGAALVAHRL
jgi:glucokinase